MVAHFPRRWISSAAVLAASLFLVTAAPQPARPAESQTAQSFQVVVDSDIAMSVEGQEQKIVTTTNVLYTLKRTGQKVLVCMDEVQIKASANGRAMMNATMSARKMVTVSDGKTTEISAADAPDDLKSILKDSFGPPLCELELDATGGEIKRKIVAGPGAKRLIDNGVIASARLFHASFPSDKNKWQAPAEVSMGSGGYARGQLDYEKLPGGAAGRTAVKVSGTLVSDDFKPAGSPLTLKNNRYAVSGQQTYDAARKEWIAGDMTLQVSFDMAAGEKTVGKAKGTMKVKLTTVGK
jgi:hypothetical protein